MLLESDAVQMRLSGKNSLMQHVKGCILGVLPLPPQCAKTARIGDPGSPELLRRPDSVRMTGLCGVRDVGILVGIRHGYREAAAEPGESKKHLAISHWQIAFVSSATARQRRSRSFTPAVSPRLDLGIQDGMSLGMAVFSLRAAIGRWAFTIWLYIRSRP